MISVSHPISGVAIVIRIRSIWCSTGHRIQQRVDAVTAIDPKLWVRNCWWWFTAWNVEDTCWAMTTPFPINTHGSWPAQLTVPRVAHVNHLCSRRNCSVGTHTATNFIVVRMLDYQNRSAVFCRGSELAKWSNIRPPSVNTCDCRYITRRNSISTVAEIYRASTGMYKAAGNIDSVFRHYFVSTIVDILWDGTHSVRHSCQKQQQNSKFYYLNWKNHPCTTKLLTTCNVCEKANQKLTSNTQRNDILYFRQWKEFNNTETWHIQHNKSIYQIRITFQCHCTMTLYSSYKFFRFYLCIWTVVFVLIHLPFLHITHS